MSLYNLGNLDIISIVGAIGSLATIIALILAIWQTNEARKQTEKLKVISDALSTKYIGEYPHYFPKTINLIENTKRELRILCAIPTHGFFTAHEDWILYRQSLERTIGLHNNDPVDVICVFGDSDIRHEFRLDKNKLGDFEHWKSIEKNKTMINFVLSRSGVNPEDFKKMDSDEFAELLEKVSFQEASAIYNNSNFRLHTVSYRPPFYFWISDEKEAIFVIFATKPDVMFEAFWTADARIIKTLIKIHQEMCQN